MTSFVVRITTAFDEFRDVFAMQRFKNWHENEALEDHYPLISAIAELIAGDYSLTAGFINSYPVPNRFLFIHAVSLLLRSLEADALFACEREFTDDLRLARAKGEDFEAEHEWLKAFCAAASENNRVTMMEMTGDSLKFELSEYDAKTPADKFFALYKTIAGCDLFDCAMELGHFPFYAKHGSPGAMQSLRSAQQALHTISDKITTGDELAALFPDHKYEKLRETALELSYKFDQLVSDFQKFQSRQPKGIQQGPVERGFL